MTTPPPPPQAASAADAADTAADADRAAFRCYDVAPPRVRESYRKARACQTVSFVERMRRKFGQLETRVDVWELLESLNDLVDASDPDTSHPNMHHAIQTAERMRADGLPDWMQLVGLLHDAGKAMHLRGCDAEGTGRNEQWAMVGDTFVVGCALPDALVYNEFNALNPDMQDPRYNTRCGRYAERCGLDAVACSWGHDEYLYQILASDKNPNDLPAAARYIVRYHSLYAHHRERAYDHLLSETDHAYLPLVQQFSEYDLYSKDDDVNLIADADRVKPYYMGLLRKYFRGRTHWWI